MLAKSRRLNWMVDVVTFKWKADRNKVVRLPSYDHVKYNSAHVNLLYRKILENTTVDVKFHCITDDAEGLHPDINVIPLWDHLADLGGCYRRLYIYSSDMAELIGPRFTHIDLDTTIVGNIDHILTADGDFIYYKMAGADGTGRRFNCSLFTMDAGVRNDVWYNFIARPNRAIAVSRRHAGTDQAWCNTVLNLDEEICYDVKDGIYYIKHDFMDKGRTAMYKDATMIMWPGPRDPNEEIYQQQYPWLKTYYET